ncbi:methyltransferase domain-containing protein [Nonomuraea sp. NPDC049725]|uniref:SAM-dependent methyltransferase n=1 Tax=Nonomuraea sp. NPDC049725 TaxID=3154508 RepID=UPI00343DED67
MNQYDVAVPFYDLWHEDGHVPAARAALPSVLARVRGPVLEIGAGTGLITEVIAAATGGEIFAVEPAAGMRAVLVSRLAQRPGLLERVTVLPYGALDADVDEPVGAVVMIAVLQAFDAATRPRLWETLARQLRPGGLLVFDRREPAPAVPGEPELLGSYRVGRHRYEVHGHLLAAEGELTRWRFRYVVTQRGVVIGEDEVISESHRPTRARLDAELTAAGFTRADAPGGLDVWRFAK